MSENRSSVGALKGYSENRDGSCAWLQDQLLSIIPYRLGGLIPQLVALETHTKHGSFNLTSTFYLNVRSGPQHVFSSPYLMPLRYQLEAVTPVHAALCSSVKHRQCFINGPVSVQ